MVQVIDNNKYSIDGFTTTCSTVTLEYDNGYYWNYPEIIDVIETENSIKIVYKQTQSAMKLDFLDTPICRVFKIVFSCKDGKWHKSERIYGNIIPASDETYEFND